MSVDQVVRKVLVLEDSPFYSKCVGDELHKLSSAKLLYEPIIVGSVNEAREKMSELEIYATIIDCNVPRVKNTSQVSNAGLDYAIELREEYKTKLDLRIGVYSLVWLNSGQMRTLVEKDIDYISKTVGGPDMQKLKKCLTKKIELV
tara:strand:- start:824 stop:1261 length:438 start_codon:yes stop_codon:yes gene_type:complete